MAYMYCKCGGELNPDSTDILQGKINCHLCEEPTELEDREELLNELIGTLLDRVTHLEGLLGLD